MNDTVMNSNVHLFDVRQAVMWRTWNNKPLTSDKAFYGQNPPNGAILNFYLKSALADRESVAITIQDSAGQVVRTYNCGRRPTTTPQTPQGQGFGGGGGGGGFGGGGGGGNQCFAAPGLNRFQWDLRARSTVPQLGSGGPGGGGGGGGFGGGGGQGFRVDPGDYTVKIKLGETEMSKTVKVVEDPRINFSAEDRAKKKAALTSTATFDDASSYRSIYDCQSENKSQYGD